MKPPDLDRVRDQLRKGDVLVVWRLNRLGRSLKHLIELMNEMESAGIGFCSLQESINTTMPGGKLVFHIFGALAEFERNPDPRSNEGGLWTWLARGEGRPSQGAGRGATKVGGGPGCTATCERSRLEARRAGGSRLRAAACQSRKSG